MKPSARRVRVGGVSPPSARSPDAFLCVSETDTERDTDTDTDTDTERDTDTDTDTADVLRAEGYGFESHGQAAFCSVTLGMCSSRVFAEENTGTAHNIGQFGRASQ